VDGNHLVKRYYLQHKRIIIPQSILQGMTNNVGLTFSVGHTTLRFTISIEHDN
jgi:hypothetical protein